jgi:regulatory protein
MNLKMPEENKKIKYYSKEEALNKARKYCAFQERCHSEVRNKLLQWGQRGIALEEIMSQLINENFLNEERFAVAYAGGKFRIKGWGISKITNELKKRHVSEYCIRKALQQIHPAEYKKSLLKIIEKKNKVVKEANPFKRKYKLAQFAAAKGYEAEQVWEVLNEMRFP